MIPLPYIQFTHLQKQRTHFPGDFDQCTKLLTFNYPSTSKIVPQMFLQFK